MARTIHRFFGTLAKLNLVGKRYDYLGCNIGSLADVEQRLSKYEK